MKTTTGTGGGSIAVGSPGCSNRSRRHSSVVVIVRAFSSVLFCYSELFILLLCVFVECGTVAIFLYLLVCTVL